MNTLKEDEVIINLKLLKQCHFYQIFDPNERMIFGFNVHKIYYIVCVGIVQCLIIYGISGIFFVNEDSGNNIDYFIMVSCLVNIQFGCLKVVVYIYNANKISAVLNVTRFDLFTSKQCVGYKNILNSDRDKLRTFTNWYAIISSALLVLWLITPVLVNLLTTSDCSNVRFQNILNLSFGVSAHTFNQYYVIFYSIELLIFMCGIYCYFMGNLILISFCKAIMSQQEVLIQALKNFGHDDNPQPNCFKELKSILHDQVQLNVKIKSLFVVVKHVVLIRVAIASASIILLTYRIIMIYSNMEPGMLLSLLKIGSAALYVSIELYIYGYLFDNMNTQRELMNFSLYSCNWTQMDLKFKKLILLAMRMNDANNLVMKASPKKIINLQVFANIMSMSYNIISVMLKTTSTKNEI